MKLRFDQLKAHLSRELAPVYLIYGDEPLLVQEAADAVRAGAKAQGFLDRQVFQAEPGFDWNTLHQAAESLSLFAERRILDVRVPTGKPGEGGAKVLAVYAERPPEDTLLLVTCGRLEAATRRSRWVNALEKAGVAVEIWPVDRRRLAGWIAQRCAERGMRPSAEAAALIAERVEGNLLAAAQEVDKLLLLHGPGPLDAAQVLEAVADSSRYSVYDLADSVLAGDAVRSLRILAGLRAEGTEPVLVLWALAREVRALAGMARDLAAGGSLQAVLGRYKVWERRRSLVSGALRRHRPHEWARLLRHCHRVDRVIKGTAPGNPWDELVQLSLGMAGINPLRTSFS